MWKPDSKKKETQKYVELRVKLFPFGDIHVRTFSCVIYASNVLVQVMLFYITVGIQLIS